MYFKNIDRYPDYFTLKHSDNKYVEYLVNIDLERKGLELRFDGLLVTGIYHNIGNDNFTLQVKPNHLRHIPINENADLEIVKVIREKVGTL